MTFRDIICINLNKNKNVERDCSAVVGNLWGEGLAYLLAFSVMISGISLFIGIDK